MTCLELIVLRKPSRDAMHCVSNAGFDRVKDSD
jgi:hypothetical protein